MSTKVFFLLFALLQTKRTLCAPSELQTELTPDGDEATTVMNPQESRAAGESTGGLTNPLEGLQQIFNPNTSGGRPMAVLGTFQTLLMPMPSLTEGFQQGQTIINGMNTLGSVFKPLVDGVQSIQG